MRCQLIHLSNTCLHEQRGCYHIDINLNSFILFNVSLNVIIDLYYIAPCHIATIKVFVPWIRPRPPYTPTQTWASLYGMVPFTGTATVHC